MSFFRKAEPRTQRQRQSSSANSNASPYSRNNVGIGKTRDYNHRIQKERSRKPPLEIYKKKLIKQAHDTRSNEEREQQLLKDCSKRRNNISSIPEPIIKQGKYGEDKSPALVYIWDFDGIPCIVKVIKHPQLDTKRIGYLVKYGRDNYGENGDEGSNARYPKDSTANSVVKCIGDSDRKKLEIALVYTISNGYCTRAVSSVLYAVKDAANSQQEYYPNGQVYIQSAKACKAFNCYNRAFNMNGYFINSDQGDGEWLEELSSAGNYPESQITFDFHSSQQAILDFYSSND